LLHGAALPDTLSPEKTLYKIIKDNPEKKYIKIQKLCNFFFELPGRRAFWLLTQKIQSLGLPDTVLKVFTW